MLATLKRPSDLKHSSEETPLVPTNLNSDHPDVYSLLAEHCFQDILNKVPSSAFIMENSFWSNAINKVPGGSKLLDNSPALLKSLFCLVLSFPALIYLDPTREYAEQHHFSEAMKSWSIFSSVAVNIVLNAYTSYQMLDDILDSYYLQKKLKMNAQLDICTAIKEFFKISAKLAISMGTTSGMLAVSREVHTSTAEALCYTFGELPLNYYSLTCLIESFKNLKQPYTSVQHQKLHEKISLGLQNIWAVSDKVFLSGEDKLSYIMDQAKTMPIPKNKNKLEFLMRNSFILTSFIVAVIGALGWILSMQKQNETITGEKNSAWVLTIFFQILPAILTWQFSSHAVSTIWDMLKDIFDHKKLPNYLVLKQYPYACLSGFLLGGLLTWPTYPSALLLLNDNYPGNKLNGIAQAGVYLYILPSLMYALVCLIHGFAAYYGEEDKKNMARLLESGNKFLKHLEKIPEEEINNHFEKIGFQAEEAVSSNKNSFFSCIESQIKETMECKKISRCSIQ
jgi:hypothetical protein